MEKRYKILRYICLMVLGEFLIILDAGFVGYLMGGGGFNPSKWKIISF